MDGTLWSGMVKCPPILRNCWVRRECHRVCWILLCLYKNIDGSEALSPAPGRCGWLTRAPALGSCSVMKMVEEGSLGAFLKFTFLCAYTLCILCYPNGLYLYSFPSSQELQMQALYTLDLIYGKQKTKAGLLIIDILWLCHRVRYVLHSRVIAFRTLQAYLS